MSPRTYVIALVCLMITLACKEEKKASPNAEESTKMEQVMAIHDEVMPRMSTIGKLVGELKAKVDTTEVGREYEKAMTDLQDAHKAMMDWMQGFGNRFDSDEILNGKALSAQKQKWLDEEKIKVKALKEQINSSIENAERILKESE